VDVHHELALSGSGFAVDVLGGIRGDSAEIREAGGLDGDASSLAEPIKADERLVTHRQQPKRDRTNVLVLGGTLSNTLEGDLSSNHGDGKLVLDGLGGVHNAGGAYNLELEHEITRREVARPQGVSEAEGLTARVK
jgi:hypothetical protein